MSTIILALSLFAAPLRVNNIDVTPQVEPPSRFVEVPQSHPSCNTANTCMWIKESI